MHNYIIVCINIPKANNTYTTQSQILIFYTGEQVLLFCGGILNRKVVWGRLQLWIKSLFYPKKLHLLSVHSLRYFQNTWHSVCHCLTSCLPYSLTSQNVNDWMKVWNCNIRATANSIPLSFFRKDGGGVSVKRWQFGPLRKFEDCYSKKSDKNCRVICNCASLYHYGSLSNRSSRA